MLTRATLDSNIYISALEFGGKPLQILELARERKFQAMISDAIVDEICGVFRDKFRWPEKRIASARVDIAKMCTRVNVSQTLTVVKNDPDDNRIIECAVACESDYLVTGDKHLLVLGSHQGTAIVNPATFLRIFQLA